MQNNRDLLIAIAPQVRSLAPHMMTRLETLLLDESLQVDDFIQEYGEYILRMCEYITR